MRVCQLLGPYNVISYGLIHKVEKRCVRSMQPACLVLCLLQNTALHAHFLKVYFTDTPFGNACLPGLHGTSVPMHGMLM